MHWQFGEMEFDEMKRNTSNWSNFGMLLRRAGLTASAGLSCYRRAATEYKFKCLQTLLSWTLVIVHGRGKDAIRTQRYHSVS